MMGVMEGISESPAAAKARELWEEGLSVIPLGAPGEDPPAWFVNDRCGGNLEDARSKWPKTPRIKWANYQKRQATEAELEAWMRNWPNCNWGVLTGWKVVVVDADSPESVAFMESGRVTRTPRKVITAKGAHFYFQASDKLPFQNSANDLAKLDKRGRGGYVVAPGSIHATGTVYTEEILPGWGDASWPELPILSAEDLRAINDYNGLEIDSGGAVRARGNLNFDATRVAPSYDGHPVAKGGRNNAAASYAGQLITAGQDAQTIMRTLSHWNEQNSPPLPAQELERTVASVMQTHLRNHPEAAIPAAPVPVVPPGMFDLFDLVNDTREPPPYLIDGLFRQGDNVLLAGPPKSMKTFLLQDLLFGMAFGRSVLGFEVPQERRIAWIQAEMPVYETQRRAREHPWVRDRMESGKPANLFVTDRSSTLAFDARGVEAMIQTIAERFDGAPDILAIDSLSSVYDRDSEDDNAKMQAFLRERLGRFREAFGEQLTIIVIHHTAKMNNATLRQDPFLAIRGASSLRGWYSAGMILHRDPEKPDSRLRHLHFELRGDIEPASMILELKGGVMRPYDHVEIDVENMIEVSAGDAFLKLFDYHLATGASPLHTVVNQPATYAPKVLSDLAAAYPKLAGKWSKAELSKAMHSLLNERGALEIFDSRDGRGRGSAKALRRRETTRETTSEQTDQQAKMHQFSNDGVNDGVDGVIR